MSRPASLRVLVTRSEPGASETAKRLQAAGHQPIVEPLFAIAPIDVDLPEFDALAFTSLNGVRRFAALSPRRDAPVFCVGARTAATAREAGFTEVMSAEGDVTALENLVRDRLPEGARLLHAGNEESRGDLTGRLVAAGVTAQFVALFRAEPVASPGPALARQIAGKPAFDVALIHSPRAAVILADMLRAAAKPAAFDVAAISVAAAAPLDGLVGRKVIAASPNEDALFSALTDLVSG